MSVEPFEVASPFAKSVRLRALTITELLSAELPPREMILAPWLPERALAMIYGPRGIGKTWIVLGLAYAAASGCQFLRWSAPKPRKTLIVDGEMPLPVLQQRLASLARLFDKEPPSPDFLRILAMDDQERGLNLNDPTHQNELEPLLADRDIVTLDNLSCLAAFVDENDASAWGPTQDWLLRQRRAGRSIVAAHHAGKSGKQRGTSRREDVLDTVIALRQPEDRRADEGARFGIFYEKSRGFFGPEAEPFEAQLGSGGWTTKSLDDADATRALHLADEEGMSVRQIAAEMGCSKSRIDRLLSRARGAARTGLAGHE